MSEYVDSVHEALNAIARAYADGDMAAVASATRRLEDVITWGNTLIHLREAAETFRAAGVASGVTREHAGSLPRIPFRGAIQDILVRRPELAEVDGMVPAYMRVAEIYRNGGGFAMASNAVPVGATDAARRAALHVTGRTAGVVATGALRGAGVPETARRVADVADVGYGYAENVVRTNMATAQTNGMFAAAQHPAVRTATPAFIYDATDDFDVRTNHWAANGMIAAVDDPIWATWRVPNGYNCRCAINLISLPELMKLGLWDPVAERVKPYIPPGVRAGARPDPGFS